MATTDLNLSTITDGTVVNGKWAGTGIFDKLMVAVTDNLDLQYQNGRIKGTDYANVYLGSIQSVLQQSMTFLLQKEATEVDILMKRAQTEDQFGKVIDDNGNMTDSANTGTQHHWAVKTAEEQYTTAGFVTNKTEKEVASTRLDNALRQAKLMVEYNLDTTDAALGETLSTYKDFLTNLSTESAKDEWRQNGIPQTLYELEIMSKRLEADVASNTATGYKADSLYKIYRSLQELMFALANSGTIDVEANGTYDRILDGMEKAMNGQADVWGINMGIDLDASDVAEKPSATTPTV